eukprot:TRINITY_DN4608_c0_g1_i1.p1 TRINITY_DN4608_c0_g1~~TRINITY_DN4608_c0_g1_i1.p1  ORF type:complete len:3125 (-),score=411.22 TRINITY_DN4608_c0_g1_i1:73-9447(-)
MATSWVQAIEDICLNVFPLFVKPDYDKDAPSSQYLEAYMSFLTSDLAKELPGLDLKYVSSLLHGLKNTLELCKAYESRQLHDVVAKTKNALNTLSDGNFVVLHFPTHSCDIVVFPEKSNKDLLFVPLELRRTSFSSAEPIEENGYTRSWRIALPKTIFRVEKASITDEWLNNMADLQAGSLEDFPGVFPLGTNRASLLPDNRKSPTPTYIVEWLLPALSKTTIKVDGSIIATKAISSLRNFVGKGIPWRRSVHWNSIRFATALVQRWYGFSVEQYKMLQLGFKTLLALQYFKVSDSGATEVVKKQVEMVQRITLTSRKHLAISAATDKLIPLIAEKCQAIQQQIDAFLPAILKRKETESVLPSRLKLQNVSGRFPISDAILQSLKEGSNRGSDSLKENISSHVSPMEFVQSLNANTALDLIQSTTDQLKQAKVSIAKQKPALAAFTSYSMLHGSEDFIYQLFNSLHEEHITDLDTWATNLRDLTEAFVALVPKSASAERRSREVLALWCLLALIDRVVRKRWPDLFANVGLALPIDLLENLTLRERPLMETAANLIALKKSFGPSPGLFDYASPPATQLFAVKYFDSTEGEEMQNCLLAERAQEKVRTDKREHALEEARQEYTSLGCQPCSCSHSRCGYVTSTCRRCRRRDSLLQTACQVVHPLPIDNQIAKEVIFFASLPAMLKQYAAIAHQCYILHDTVLSSVCVQDCVSWAFSKNIQLPKQTDSPVSLVSHRKTLETNSHFKTNSSFTVAVVYPDFNLRSVAFGTYGFSRFPYDISTYQYRLTGALRNLPWMSDSKHTENMVLAAQHDMPVAMTKSEFISFGRVRASLNLQIRELIMVLDSMPDNQLESEDFLTLMHRTLYEMGPVTTDTTCKWIWKLDLFDSTWLAQLRQSLSDKLSKIRENWQSHAIMRLAIEFSTFALQFGQRDEFASLLDDAREIIHGWIKQVEQSIEESIDKAEEQLKGRLLLIQLHSYLLLASLEVTEQDLQYRSELSRLKSVCEDNITVPIYSLLALVDSRIFNHSIDIHKLIARYPSLLHRVLSKIGITVEPDELSWERVNMSGKLLDWYSSGPYMVNPISGLILCDGLTVSELPSVIMQAPLYQEVMKNANFIVQRVNNEYITSHGNRKFKFGLWNHYPFIHEQRGDKEFTLLPRQYLTNSNLPKHLVANMAHWIDFDKRIIEFRPTDFRKTDFSYWMTLDTQECFINDSQKGQLLNAYDENLRELTKQLTRIAPIESLIFSKSPLNEFKVELSDMTFTLREDGEVISNNYPGYKLTSKQVVPTFPLFSDYLYIEPQSRFSTKLPLVLIVYKGSIYPYEFDEVHQRLIPPTTLARLVLAIVYAESSCTLDPLTNTSGLQQALVLLQQCWQNSPYSRAEFDVLNSLMNQPEDSPIVYAIKLLIYHLVQEAKKVSFLHPSQVVTASEWLNTVQRCQKQYFKNKHILPVGCTLDGEVENALMKLKPPKKSQLNGSYFNRVPEIFFSKETLPSTFAISKFFSQDTSVSGLVGELPSHWLRLGQATNNQLFFWFIRQLNRMSHEQILTRLTFLAHNTLLKNGDLELLKCLYCTLTTPNFCRPDIRLLNTDTIYSIEAVQSHEVIALAPRYEYSNAQLAWSIYAPNYLDINWRPTSFFNEKIGDAFWSLNVYWKYDFLASLSILHNKRFIGRLFEDFCRELIKPRTFNVPTVILTELTSFDSFSTSLYQWPVVDLESSNFKLDSLNKYYNGFNFFETKLSTLWEAVGSEPLVDLNALRKQESDLQEQTIVMAKDRTKAAERRALNDKLDEVQALLHIHEADFQPVNFPLSNQSAEGSVEIQSRIVNELKESYQKHFDSQQPSPKVNTNLKTYLNLKEEVDRKRALIWIEIARILTSVDHPLLKLWQATNLLAKPHQRIIPSLLNSSDKEYRLVNPSIGDTKTLHELALHFAVLHVHAIKLGRLIELLNDLKSTSEESDRQGFESQLHAELTDKREWDPRVYPEWLIFEMERRVCIRSIQVEIASKMLNEKNIVLQLNMGEGKSKVIVPILCSVMANGQILVRVNVLASLFHEVHSYLKLALGNMLGKRIYLFPFRRNVALSESALATLRNQFEECKAHGGIILSTPEHRLSLQLKYREVLWQYNHTKLNNALTAKDFKGIIDTPILELLDESDEILRHKYQLIYTLGDQQSIEGGSSRWHVHLAIVRCIFMANLYHSNKDAVPEEYLDKNLSGPARLEKLYDIMSTSEAHFVFQSSPNESHVLPTVRLINEEFFGSLREALFSVFQLDPVWHLIAKGRFPEELKQIEDFVMNNYPDTPDGDKRCDAFKKDSKLDNLLEVAVLVLRGLLSFEILKTSLMRRHRIHYGIDKSRKVPMAVPFRGKDTPAEGVEFGQPDMAITLTILAHSTGIDSAAVKSCFVYLKTKGINEQRKFYQRWYKISKSIMHDHYVTLLEKIEAVNVENVNLMQHLALYFGRNYEVIAYYLDNFVLPSGTRSFPEKIVANSWDLAKSSEKVVGFSGTDDTKHTLPLYVQQLALPSVESTNGKMIDVLTNERFNNRQYRSLPKELESERILQEMCNKDNWNVLIDSGALIEGMSNREVVMKVLEICPRFQTGIFFDESNRLALIDRHGYSAQLNSSRPLELTCFTYLDDIHTRGTDLPFPTKSHAFVTVATGITKDKLMQACMRMRKLVHGLHNVTFWGTSEVTMKIQQMSHNQGLTESDITSVQILEWVVENTIKAQEEAIITYASQGFHHYAAAMALDFLHNNPLLSPSKVIKAIVLKELLATDDMYGIPLKSVNMKDHINQHGTRTKGELLGREINQSLSEEASPLYTNLIGQASQLVPTGRVVRVCGSVNEEYERELQQEVEEERQRELPSRASPVQETPWAYNQINACNFMSIAREGYVTPLTLLPLKQIFSATILHADWSENKAFVRNDVIGNIFVTNNFLSTVQSHALSDYIRPIDVVIKLNADKTYYLLVSLFEANELLKYVNATNTHVEFHHLRHMHGTNNDEHRCITLLKLLNGCLSFTEQEKTALMMLLSLVPDKMNMIDQSIIGVPLLTEEWQQTWTMLPSAVLDKHNGFVEERDEVTPPSGPHNTSLIKLISLLNQARLFSTKPAKFIHELLTLRDTIRDYNYSDLHSLFGNI